jgi:hypothetical protein
MLKKSDPDTCAGLISVNALKVVTSMGVSFYDLCTLLDFKETNKSSDNETIPNNGLWKRQILRTIDLCRP